MQLQRKTAVIYLLGNPTMDRIRVGKQNVRCYGGTVLYAGRFLVRMNWAASVVGKGSLEQRRYLEQLGIQTRHFRIFTPATRFENRYVHTQRIQWARAGAAITLEDIPREAYTARAILAGPVLGELNPKIVTVPRTARMLVDMQGFLRRLDSNGRVYLESGRPAETAAAHADILKLDRAEAEAMVGSADDLPKAAERLHALGAGCVLITCGRDGAFVSNGSSRYWLPAPRVEVVDSTGAGDVFGAAFLVKSLESGGTLLESGRFAAAAAALSTRATGTEAVPGRGAIAALLQSHNDPLA